MTSHPTDVPEQRGAPLPGTPRPDGTPARDLSGDTVQELAHRADVPQRLREKRAEVSERMQAQVAHAREVVAEQAPAVEKAVRERPLVVGGVLAALLFLFVRILFVRSMRRRARRKEDADGTR